jgi:hypothetical protein
MKTCGARPGGPSLDGIDLTKQTVIQGIILRDGIDDAVPNGVPVSNGHVRLLDGSGEFTAEVPQMRKDNSASSLALVFGHSWFKHQVLARRKKSLPNVAMLPIS